MSEKISKAYCVEHKRIMDIDDAKEAYFAQAEPRKRFTFLCSDEQCRNLTIPSEITGVNYSSEGSKREAHFRRNPKCNHADTCYWGIYHAMESDILSNRGRYEQEIKDGGKNLFRPFKNIDTRDIDDELYIPQINDLPESIPHIVREEHGNIRQKIRNQILYEHKRTRDLTKVVDNFRELDDAGKKEAKLTLPTLPRKSTGEILQATPRTSYNTAFKHAKYIESVHLWTHIYYGEVRVFRCHKEFSGYKIYFQNSCDYYRDKTLYRVMIVIKDSEIKNTHQHYALQKMLQYYSQTEKKCCCYSLANATCLQKAKSSTEDQAEAASIVLIDAFDTVLRETTSYCR